MPITSSAKIALRKDKNRTIDNIRRKRMTKKSVDAYKANPSQKLLQEAISKIDKMVKYHLYHKNKAARLKSQLTNMLNIKTKKK